MRRVWCGLALVLLGALATNARAENAEPESLFDLLCEKYDADKDGVIAAAEYTRGAAAFRTMDRNADEVLTKADFPRPHAPPPGMGRPPFPGGPRCPGGPGGPGGGGGRGGDDAPGRPVADGPREAPGPRGPGGPGGAGRPEGGPREGACPCCGRPFGPPPPREGREPGGRAGPRGDGPPPGAPPFPPEGEPVLPAPPGPPAGAPPDEAQR